MVLKPAVAYLRRSYEKQEKSLEEQRTAIIAYAAEHGYEILRWYQDDGISGDLTDKRLAFQEMIADAQSLRDFSYILCWDQSRFGRFDPHEANYWTFLLKKAGVQLVTVDKGPINWDSFIEWLTYSVEQHGKKQFLVDLSKDVTRGQLESLKKGSWVGSPPYAYDLEGPKKNKRLVVTDPAKVLIVQRIFREYVQDRRSMGSIAKRLNEDAVTSPGERGKSWGGDTVKSILENPAYTGDFAGGRWSYGKYHSIQNGKVAKSNGRRRKPKQEWIIIPDHHDAIIDRDTFEEAQTLLEKGRPGRIRHTPETECNCPSGA